MRRPFLAASAACLLLPALVEAQSRRPLTYDDYYRIEGWTPWRTVHRYWASIEWWRRWLEGRPST